jgi:hypothetical protein
VTFDASARDQHPASSLHPVVGVGVVGVGKTRQNSHAPQLSLLHISSRPNFFARALQPSSSLHAGEGIFEQPTVSGMRVQYASTLTSF